MDNAHPLGARPEALAPTRPIIDGRSALLDSGPHAVHDQRVPIYDFACVTCDEKFEELVRSDAPPPACPSCGNEETERLLSTFLTPNLASGQRRFQRDVGAAMAQMGCCGGGGCGTHAG
jgi:putative FmdB family regulatory protein